jgi:hypothetical protein
MTSTNKFLTARVTVVREQGNSFTISQVRWGVFRCRLYLDFYHLTCPLSDVRFGTPVFLSHANGRCNPQKPLHTTFHKSRGKARKVITQLTEQVADGRLAFQAVVQT